MRCPLRVLTKDRDRGAPGVVPLRAQNALPTLCAECCSERAGSVGSEAGSQEHEPEQDALD